ncbi:alpha/beta fold hydrolase [Amycolatopsis sp. CA-128772]|uniref:alpha/beta fold hydrolase n=1 Tax=Amycolatopsis sp. CA-128772 TaxID=2073159 RepID=UPI000CD2104A|nr:alpha/beta fold hydrolase [Amycolatopsis sp. CA-128772]
MHHRYATVAGHRLFYREAGPAEAPTIVLLHGFPTSSHMFRHLIPLLAGRYHVIAPDYLGAGASDAPPVSEFTYTFDALADLTLGLLDQIGVTRFALYIQDFGAPVGLRIAAAHPDRVTAIITQNGNAYVEGLGAGLPQKLAAGTLTDEDLRGMVTLEATKAQYLDGVPDPTLVSPDVWIHDQALLDRPGAAEIQLALLADYHHNIGRYPKFHEYFRTSQVPLLAVWGGNDEIFVADGARAYARDLPDAEIHLLDSGHFALETHLDTIAGYIRGFLGRVLPVDRDAG